MTHIDIQLVSDIVRAASTHMDRTGGFEVHDKGARENIVTSSDLAIGLSVEASELLEAFLWKAPEDVNPEKIRKNAAKYPVDKAKGSAKKYNEL